MMKRGFLLSLLLLLFIIPLSAQNWDINTLKKINRIDNGFVKGYSKAFSKTTPYVAVGVPVIMAAYALIDKDKDLFMDAVYIGSSVAEAVVISWGLKYAIDRQRPFDRYPDLIDKRDSPSSASFPSGHTAAAFSLATSLCLKYPKWYVIAPSALWACSVGFARMNEGVHYPSDVLSGAVIGAGCAVANVYINKWLNKLIFPESRTKVVTY